MSGALQAVFGFMRSSIAGFAFMGMKTNAASNQWGGTSVATLTILPNQPTPQGLKAIGVAVDGSFIAVAGSSFSTNGGASWTSWASAGNYTPTGMPPGINGGIAYNPTAKRAFCFATEYYPKYNTFYFTTYTVNSTGTPASSAGGTMGSQTYVGNVIYSPALNYFYVMNFSSGYQSYWYVSGTTGVSGTVTSAANGGNHRAGVSSDGYPLQAAYTGSGALYNLRKYTSADLSSYYTLGTISDGYSGLSIQSIFFWAPVNNKYLKGAANSNGSTILLSSAPVGSPQAYSPISSVYPSSAYGIITIGFLEQTNGTLWLFGQYSINAGKAGIVQTPYTYSSTDGGVNWTLKSGDQFLTLSKNFTP